MHNATNKTNKKKLLFITTGGTIASAQTPQGLAPALSSEELLAQMPELDELCQPFTRALFSIDSTNMRPAHWLRLADTIRQEYDAYDGFIICHGTDTMAYTAAALSYLIQDADKPVILTGAQKPISWQITDAKKNLRDSVLCALDPLSRGVMVVFDGQVIAGTRAKKIKTYSYDAFTSINFPCLAQVREDGLLRYIESPRPSGPPRFYSALDEKVFLLKLTPGLSPAILAPILELYDCIVVESFGVGGMPDILAEALAEQLRRYAAHEKIVILGTQVPYEGSDVGVYAVGGQLKKQFRFLEARDMTLEACCAKIMWLMGQKELDYAAIERAFYSRINFDTYL